jgi:hypothetical protein
MNQKELMFRRNDAIRELDAMCRIGRNYCKFNSTNSDSHEDTKWAIFKFLRRLQKDVVTEAVFKEGRGRADMVVLDDMMVIEILHNETLQEFQLKKEKYPSIFQLVPVSTSDKIGDVLEQIGVMLE